VLNLIAVMLAGLLGLIGLSNIDAQAQSNALWQSGLTVNRIGQLLRSDFSQAQRGADGAQTGAIDSTGMTIAVVSLSTTPGPGDTIVRSWQGRQIDISDHLTSTGTAFFDWPLYVVSGTTWTLADFTLFIAPNGSTLYCGTGSACTSLAPPTTQPSTWTPTGTMTSAVTCPTEPMILSSYVGPTPPPVSTVTALTLDCTTGTISSSSDSANGQI
jgi:hypothetical protein